MTPDSRQAADVKAALDALIQAASSFNFDILETTYHDSMSIYMLDANNELHLNDKRGFIDHVRQATEATEKPDTWAKYHLVEADETHGHVVISRKVNLTGKDQLVTLSIDFLHEDGRWQITREVIFAGVLAA